MKEAFERWIKRFINNKPEKTKKGSLLWTKEQNKEIQRLREIITNDPTLVGSDYNVNTFWSKEAQEAVQKYNNKKAVEMEYPST